jgi:hypothetical protein
LDPRRQGWYSERFGDLRPNSVLILKGEVELPFVMAYAVSLQGPVALAGAGEARVIRATHLGRVFECALEGGPPDAAP